MIDKIKAVLGLFRAGRRVADPALWKTRQITTSVLVAAIWSAIHAAGAMGITVAVDAETVDAVAVAVLAVVNCVLTVTTTDKIGLRAVADSDDA